MNDPIVDEVRKYRDEHAKKLSIEMNMQKNSIMI